MNRMDNKSEPKNVMIEKLFRISPILIAFLVILTPHIKLPLIPAIRLEQVLIAVILIMEIYFYGFSRLKVILKNKMIYLVLGLTLYMIITIVNGSFSGYKVLYNDFFELIKVAVYFGTYLVLRLNIKNDKDRNQLLKYILFFIFIASLVAITQYFNFFNMNELYIRRLAPTQFITLVDGYPSPRVIGLTGNPNFFALFASIAGFIAFRDFLTSGSWKSIFTMTYFFVILNMTKSRSGFLFYVMGIMVLILLEGYRRVRKTYQKEGNRKGNRALFTLFIALLFISGLFVSFIAYGPEALTWRLKHGLDIRNDGSFLTRVRRWKEYIELFDLPQLLGVGPTKSVHFSFQVDNEWLIFIKELGLLGTILMILTFVLPVIKDKVNPYKDLYFAVILAGALFMMTSVFVNIHQVMPLVMMLAALSKPVLYDEEEYTIEDSIYH